MIKTTDGALGEMRKLVEDKYPSWSELKLIRSVKNSEYKLDKILKVIKGREYYCGQCRDCLDIKNKIFEVLKE